MKEILKINKQTKIAQLKIVNSVLNDKLIGI